MKINERVGFSDETKTLAEEKTAVPSDDNLNIHSQNMNECSLNVSTSLFLLCFRGGQGRCAP